MVFIMSLKISIIIPIYNAYGYLRKCLDSVCRQSYTNLEIICVDDGSTDGTGDILDEFAKNDKRIIALHQENHGESNARNTALKMASGEYIGFVDCDDWIDFDMYETMIQKAAEYDLDIVATSWYREDDWNCQMIQNEMTVKKDIINRDELLKYIYMRDSYRGFAYMWNKIYKRNILTDREGNLIKFDETLRIGGDVLFLAQAAIRANRTMYMEQSFYHYIQRKDSGCHMLDLEKMQDWLRAYDMTLQLLMQENVENATLDYVKRFMAYHSCNAVKIALEESNDEMKKYFQEYMFKYCDEYVKLNKDYPLRVQEFVKYMAL